jgi:hypothetical protein
MRPIRTLVAVLFVATIAMAGCSAQTTPTSHPDRRQRPT